MVFTLLKTRHLCSVAHGSILIYLRTLIMCIHCGNRYTHSIMPVVEPETKRMGSMNFRTRLFISMHYLLGSTLVQILSYLPEN